MTSRSERARREIEYRACEREWLLPEVWETAPADRLQHHALRFVDVNVTIAAHMKKAGETGGFVDPVVVLSEPRDVVTSHFLRHVGVCHRVAAEDVIARCDANGLPVGHGGYERFYRVCVVSAESLVKKQSPSREDRAALDAWLIKFRDVHAELAKARRLVVVIGSGSRDLERIVVRDYAWPAWPERDWLQRELGGEPYDREEAERAAGERYFQENAKASWPR